MKFHQFLYNLHLLSFDVAVGAVVQTLAIQKFTNFIFPNDFFLLLPLSILFIYWIDRLLDVAHWKINNLISLKHRFYKQNHLFILILTVILGIFLFIKGLFFSSEEVFQLGILGGFLMLIYFFIHHKYKGSPILYYFKEFMVAGIYSFVLWFLPFQYSFNYLYFFAWLALFLNAILNLWILSMWDKSLDEKMKIHSIAQLNFTEKFLKILFLITIFVSTLLLIGDYGYGTCFIIMSLLHVLIWKYGNSLERYWIEFIFWVPIFYVIIG